MENQHKGDELIRKMVRQKGPEKAPDDFTDKVMGRINSGQIIEDTPILSKGAWIAIILGVAAMIVIIFTMDMPLIEKLFSSTGFEQVSMNIFTKGFISSMADFIKSLPFTRATVSILIAAGGLVVLERILHRKFKTFVLICI